MPSVQDISLWELGRHFSGWTSVNGLPHVFLTDNNCIRLIWVLIVGGAFVAGLYQTVALIDQYLSYAVNVETKSNFDELAFPSVTICNVNAWKLTKASGTPLQTLISAYNQPAGSARFGLTWPQSEQQRRARAQQWMWQIGEKAQMAAQNGSQIGYSFEEMFEECQFDAQPCNQNHFNDFYDVHFGRCFQFNRDGLLNSSRPGAKNGLRVLLRVNASDYLPWTDVQGAVVVVEHPNALPFPSDYGFFARPGTSARFGVQSYQRNKLPSPFSNCTDLRRGVSTQPIYFNGDYQEDSCFRSCAQDRIVYLCGCYTPLYARPTNTSNPAALLSCYDSPNPNWALDCLNSVVDFQNSSQWNPYYDCDCPSTCDQSYYRISATEAKWPAKNNIPLGCTSGVWRDHFSSAKKCREWYGLNTVRVEVFHQRILTICVTETQSYEVIDFIADAGGALGLWLGMSSMSMLEAFIFFVMAVAYCCARPAKRARIQPGYDYFGTLVREEMARKEELKKTAEAEVVAHQKEERQPDPVKKAEPEIVTKIST